MSILIDQNHHKRNQSSRITHNNSEDGEWEYIALHS